MIIRFVFLLTFTYFLNYCIAQPFIYPEARKDSITDTYFGTAVNDPYRWMENAQSDDTRKWVEQENQLSRAYLEKLTKKYPIKDQMDLNSHITTGFMYKSGKYYFQRFKDGTPNHVSLYIKESYKEIPSLIVDPFDYRQGNKDIVNIEQYNVSNDNKHLAFAISHNGSDWREIHVKTIDNLKDGADVVKWVKFSSISWAADGFYYSRFPETEKDKAFTEQLVNQAVYYHKLGTNQSDDKFIYSNPENPAATIYADVIGQEHYLLLYTTRHAQNKVLNEVSYINLKKQENTKPQLLMSSSYNYTIIDEYNGQFLASTMENAPHGKLVLVNPDSMNQSKLSIKQYKNILRQTSIIGDKVVCLYLTDIEWSCITFDSTGTAVNVIKFPPGTSVNGFDGDSKSNVTLFSYMSCLYPYVIYEYDVNKLKATLIRQGVVQYDAHDLEVKKVFVTSKDGEQIPMIIASKKGMKKDGKTPTILYGYGGFGVTSTPSFDIGFINHILDGGIIALPCIRGGGEYGEEWHVKGKLLNKQNSFDDFIAAAEYLVDSGYTKKDKLAIMGGSNGGLLVGTVITQRPDICKVAVSRVGVFDMLRYHLYTIGSAWESEYGTSKNAVQFPYIYKYSPLHNVKENTNYPAMLIITGDHDDRVVPMHSYKFVATLQEKNKTGNPILLVTAKNSGHNGGGSMEMEAFTYSFIYQQLGVKPRDLY